MLGLFTGVLAYYLHETNPRTAPPPDQRLHSLVEWKREKWRREREEKERRTAIEGGVEEEVAVVAAMLREEEANTKRKG